MKFLSYACLMSISFIALEPLVNGDSNCASPSEYIMQFLKRSGTLVQGVQNWKNELQEGTIVKTNFLVIRSFSELKEYAGFMVWLHDMFHYFGEVPVDTAKGNFEIALHNGIVEIKSNIQDIHVITNQDKIASIKKIPETSTENQSDFCSMCDYIAKLKRDEKAKTVHYYLNAQCTSKMPYAVFMEKIKS